MGDSPMDPNKKIQIIYHAGMFGYLIRFILDRSLLDSKLKNIIDPFTKEKNVHQPFEYNAIFSNSHQVNLEDFKFLKERYPWIESDTRRPDPDARKIIVSFDEKDEIFAHRCNFYRSPWIEENISNTDAIIYVANKKFVEETFNQTTPSTMIAKELKKIEFHNSNQIWMNEYKKFLNKKDYYYFNIRNLLDSKTLEEEIVKISSFFNLQLIPDTTWLKFIVEKVLKIFPVATIDRCNDVYSSIVNKQNVDCADLDIIEQAWIETQLEKNYDSLLFPYGTSWFKNTDQINEFLNTYPSYLKHMNPRLPWYNGIKNPFYLTGKVDESK
jgi:hypothetical protein